MRRTRIITNQIGQLVGFPKRDDATFGPDDKSSNLALPTLWQIICRAVVLLVLNTLKRKESVYLIPCSNLLLGALVM